ncbi:MAG TPA: M23 family metallopeptidase [Thermoleophilaceae bacterium]|nr:M23 family metallopeptidase [Thermoleophilaceae bacterium]
MEAAPDYGSSGARFGAPRSGHMHEGQDLFAPAGTPLVAASDGVVLETGSDGGRGNFVAMYGPARDETFVYLHMLAPAEVTVGERVEAGQRVGEVGCTGTCFGDHLHFEVREGSGTAGPAEDPLPLLQELDG